MNPSIHDQNMWIAALIILVGIATLMAPVMRYVCVGWRAKRKDIMDGLDTSARVSYFRMYGRDGEKLDDLAASKAFEKLYHNWYGRRFFITPTFLLFVVGSMTVISITFTGLHRFGFMSNPLFDLPDTAMAALAGAYLWVVHDHTWRTRRLDFAPSDVHWGTLRLVIAIPMGYAFAAVAAKSVGPTVAFALGAFPLDALILMMRRLTEKQLGATSVEASDDIIALQGVNKEIMERLRNEDITTVTQIAYCDPVRLVMRSNLTFNFVTDCMGQALAWLYFEDKLAALRPLGMRGAVEIKNLIDAYDADVAANPKLKTERDRAAAALPKIAEAIKQDPSTVESAFREIAGDPYTEFLSDVWT